MAEWTDFCLKRPATAHDTKKWPISCPYCGATNPNSSIYHSNDVIEIDDDTPQKAKNGNELRIESVRRDQRDKAIKIKPHAGEKPHSSRSQMAPKPPKIGLDVRLYICDYYIQKCAGMAAIRRTNWELFGSGKVNILFKV